MSQRDLRLGEALAGLRRDGLRSYLTLASNAHETMLDETIATFGALPLAGCVLTKLDECPSLGGALSAVIRHRLPVACVTDGQRVPEDLRPARARDLVSLAAQRVRSRAEQARRRSVRRRSSGRSGWLPMLEAAFDQAQGLRGLRAARPVQVIAVTGGKGGVGKTNVSVNLGVALAQRGRGVMLLDADLGLANVDVLLGLKPRWTLAHVLRRRARAGRGHRRRPGRAAHRAGGVRRGRHGRSAAQRLRRPDPGLRATGGRS